MPWTEEDRRRASEQQARAQRSRDEAFQINQRQTQVRQRAAEEVRTHHHEQTMRNLRAQAPRYGSPLNFGSTAKNTGNNGSSVNTGAQVQSSHASATNRSNSFWLLCGFAIATYFLYEWQLPRFKLIGMPGAIASFVAVAIASAIFYKMRHVIVFILKWTFVVSVLGGLVYLFVHNR